MHQMEFFLVISARTSLSDPDHVRACNLMATQILWCTPRIENSVKILFIVAFSFEWYCNVAILETKFRNFIQNNYRRWGQ